MAVIRILGRSEVMKEATSLNALQGSRMKKAMLPHQPHPFRAMATSKPQLKLRIKRKTQGVDTRLSLLNRICAGWVEEYKFHEEHGK